MGSIDPRLSLPREIPASLLPPDTPHAPSRPDIMLHLPAMTTSPDAIRHDSRVIMIEIKYCCDYCPTHQVSAASAQHTQTCSLLQQANHHVTQIINLLLGVAGTIYKHAYEALHIELGLTKTQAHDVCKSLHKHAIVSLSSIYRSKLHMNRTHAASANMHPP